MKHFKKNVEFKKFLHENKKKLLKNSFQQFSNMKKLFTSKAQFKFKKTVTTFFALISDFLLVSCFVRSCGDEKQNVVKMQKTRDKEQKQQTIYKHDPV